MSPGPDSGNDTSAEPKDARFAFLDWWGEYLRRERNRRGLSQAEVALLADPPIDQARVSKAEKLGSFTNQVKVAHAFGITVEDLAVGAAALAAEAAAANEAA